MLRAGICIPVDHSLLRRPTATPQDCDHKIYEDNKGRKYQYA